MIFIQQVSKRIILGICFIVLSLFNTGCMAPQLFEEPVPSDFATFSYKSHGAPGEVEYNCFIDFNKRELRTVSFREYWVNSPDEKNPTYKEKTIKLTAPQITMLRQAFHQAQLLRWGSRYKPDHAVWDGTFWTLKYTLTDGTSRTIKGDNAWPYHIRYIVKAIKNTGAEFIP